MRTYRGGKKEDDEQGLEEAVDSDLTPVDDRNRHFDVVGAERSREAGRAADCLAASRRRHCEDDMAPRDGSLPLKKLPAPSLQWIRSGMNGVEQLLRKFEARRPVPELQSPMPAGSSGHCNLRSGPALPTTSLSNTNHC